MGIDWNESYVKIIIVEGHRKVVTTTLIILTVDGEKGFDPQKLENTNFPIHVNGFTWFSTILSTFQDIFQPKVMTGIWNIIEKVNFWPFLSNLGQTRIFPKNLHAFLFQEVSFLYLVSLYYIPGAFPYMRIRIRGNFQCG